MNKGCFVDTTVLVEALIKQKEQRRRAKAAIRSYQRSVLPIYAIKEFKAGALKGYRWAHNRLVDLGSFIETVNFINRQFPTNVKSSAQEALAMGMAVFKGSELATASTIVETQRMMADSARLHIRRRIFEGWRERRKITTEIMDELTCYAEVPPAYNEETGYIDDDRTECDLSDECCLAETLRSRRSPLRKLISAIKLSNRPEDLRRKKALYLLLERGKNSNFGNEACRNLGDAYFVLRCPTGCAILTTNFSDHVRLGSALKKEVHKFDRS